MSSAPSHFFAQLARMKLIRRWPLMRSVQPENVQEHSLQVAMLAHGLATIKNRLFDAYTQSDAAVAGLQAMETAMKASRKISTAPATGSTIGIIGTMDSTTSTGWSAGAV